MNDNDSIDELLATMARLRDPENGCPWDIKQDFQSLCTYTIEEAYEVVDAINRGNHQDLKEELGDLLFQVVFYAQIANEKGLFNFADIAQSINQKMLDRHPHVFNAKNDSNPSDVSVSKIWEHNKLQKKKKHHQENFSVLDDIPDNLPELLRSVKMTKRAAVIGFDWPSIEPVFDKMQEEILELKEAIQTGNTFNIKDELGDVLFVCTNLARHLKQDPELALRHANEKFEKRFRSVESQATQMFPELNEYDLDLLEQLWVDIKKQE